MAKSGTANFYNGVATQSLRFDDGSSAFLSRTPAGASNQKTWTFSAWIKPSNITDSSGGAIFTRHDSGSNTFVFRLDQNDDLQVENYTSGAYQLHLVTDAKFRDTSAWYHVVLSLDTTQGTAANRAKLYVNGVQQTSLSASTYPSENADLKVNAAAVHRIGARSSNNYFDGYMAEVNFVDGTQLAPTSFGETKNGVWIPIDTSGLTFGTNGFRLDFADNAVDAPTSEGTEDTDNIGSDSSGEHNNWTSSGIVASDCAMPDCPENNFCTLNPLDNDGNTRTGLPLSEGNLRGQSNVNGWDNVRSTFTMPAGKWYVELLATSGIGNGNSHFAIVPQTDVPDYGVGLGSNFYGYTPTVWAWSSNGGWYNNYVGTSGPGATGTAWAADAIVAFAFDGSTLKFYRNNSLIHTVGSIPSAEYAIGVGFYDTDEGGIMNFGQDSSFAGNKTKQSNTDANGQGDFYYEPPAGFLALCSANLPEPTIGPNSDTQADDHFNTVIYSGNNDATRTFDVGFVSDWSWFKARNQAGYGHQLYDSSRGATKLLYSNANNVESTNAEGVTSFDSSGNLAIGTDAFLNEDGTTMVIWNWKANGGTTSSNTEGSITSTVQANTTAGFSIVTYTGNATNDATVGHGLLSAPSFIITKKRGATGSWQVLTNVTSDYEEGDYIDLNGTGAVGNSANVSFAPTSTTWKMQGGQIGNIATTIVAYCFHSVEGYSKFGSYTGNGNANGTFVFTGFRLAWIMFKRTDGVTHWQIHDIKRSPVNPSGIGLLANTNDGDGVSTTYNLDITSNGFKLRDAHAGQNVSGGSYIYMAFAEAPFKYANAR